jgi:hypothetical protein
LDGRIWSGIPHRTSHLKRTEFSGHRALQSFCAHGALEFALPGSIPLARLVKLLPTGFFSDCQINDAVYKLGAAMSGKQAGGLGCLRNIERLSRHYWRCVSIFRPIEYPILSTCRTPMFDLSVYELWIPSPVGIFKQVFSTYFDECQRIKPKHCTYHLVSTS